MRVSETLRGGGRGCSAKMTSATLQDRKRRISAELEPPRGEEEEEDVIGPMPAEPAKGIKKRKGERVQMMAGNSSVVVLISEHLTCQ